MNINYHSIFRTLAHSRRIRIVVIAAAVAAVGCGKSTEDIAADATRRAEANKEKDAAAKKAALEERAAPYVKILKETLKDPYSADIRIWRFGYIHEIGYALCGEVNAKNSHGGYVGFRPFAVFDTPISAYGRVIIANDWSESRYIEEAKCFEKTGLN